jgi:mannose-1-phosphate guanylyltransferase
MLHAVIMAGGAGTRFWPASREALPKQLLALAGSRTMIQATVDRLRDLVPFENILVVTSERLVPAIQRQLAELRPESILGEPCRRDTAPCIGLAAGWVLQSDPDATMIVMPSDHVIPDVGQFQAAVRFAVSLIDQDPRRLMTFGIRPTYPAEIFGYIERGERLEPAAPNSLTTYRVYQFREKPKGPVAQQFFESGRHFWNSGIFVWRAQTILNELQEREPEIYRRVRAISEARGTARFGETFRSEFAAATKKSIDFAVMEHTRDAFVIEAPFEWDDVGSWQALMRLCGTDENGNTVIGRHVGIDTRNSIIRSDGRHVIATIGMRDCLVVHTPDATLVANKRDEEAVRAVVERLQELGWAEYL